MIKLAGTTHYGEQSVPLELYSTTSTMYVSTRRHFVQHVKPPVKAAISALKDV
jgi:hypothetical protein